MEYTDSEGNVITVALPVDNNVDKNRTLHSRFEMPDANVKLKFRLSTVYKVFVDPTLQDRIKPDPVYAMEGDTVTISITEDDLHTLDKIRVIEDKHDSNVPLIGNNQFIMPAANVTILARLRENYIERSWDGEKVVETVKTVPEDALDMANISVMSGNTLISGKTYVVRKNVKLNTLIDSSHSQVNSTVNIVLCDGARLECAGISVAHNITLNIFDQKGGTGALRTTASGDGVSAIGGFSNGVVNIHGGVITAVAENGAGIGSGYHANQRTSISIHGGTVNAQSGSDKCGGAGIGGGSGGSSGNINISGGTVKARAAGKSNASGKKNGGAGIGAGDGSSQLGQIKIDGGTVEASSVYGTGIGGGNYGSGGTVTVGEGIVSVTAHSSSGGTAIGNGLNGNSVGTLTIFDKAKVTAGTNSNNAQKVISGARVQSCHSYPWAKIEHCDHQGNENYISRGFNGHSVDCMYCGVRINDLLPHRYQKNAECADCHHRSAVTLKKRMGG